ncbi:MAG: cyclic nucleotide-binding domain-containing protein [Deltaproteobacteria bacterium]|nr:cyclic nucleotide-binding domain-containing protein [Deltaproteobacteria bacterium]
MGLKNLFRSQKKYKIIKSIVLITVLIGIFNLFFKVLFDTQVNVRYPVHPAIMTGEARVSEDLRAEISSLLGTRPDPKTEFIGKYKAFVSLFQVALQLLFIYFFAKLWLNGRILFSYPLLLIPNLIFLLWVYYTRMAGYQNLLFWGTVFACGVNELIRRVVFDSAYQLLMFSIPERLCNALRMYSRLFIKPVVIICICLVFVTLPVQRSPIPLYCFLLVLLLIGMIFVVSRIPGDYVSSLKKSVLRRVPIERAFDSLVSLENHYIVEQYRKIVAESSERFGYLYILSIIRNNYSSDLNFILARLLENEDREVRLETISIAGELGVVALTGDVEALFSRETDPQVMEACLKVIAELGPSDADVVHALTGLDLPMHLRKYVLTIAYRNGPPELKEEVNEEVVSLLDSTDIEMVLAGIWLVGELRLLHLRDRLARHFDMDDSRAFGVILGASSQMGDFQLAAAYIEHIGYDQIRDYETLNKNLALFGSKSFDIVSHMIHSIIASKSYYELGTCLHTLQFVPSQDSLEFLANTLFNFDIPLVRKEALHCAARMGKANPSLDYDLFIEKLHREIEGCKEYCRYYKVIMSWNRDSLLLIELARNIEHRVWIIFKIMDLFYPDLAIFDSYYRITHTSRGQVSAGYVKAKSIEYLESLIKDEHSEFVQLLESIVFEDGFLFDVASLPGPALKVEDVYEHVLTHSYHWLRVSAILDMPPGVQKRFDPISKEAEDMIPVLERIHFLRKVSLFKGFSMMEMMMLAQITKEVKFEAGHALFEIGDPGDALYIILEGRVDIVNERERLLTALQPPQCFGEIAVLDKAGRAAKAICVDDCRMLMISRNDFQDILDKYPMLYKNIVYILTTWLREDKGGPGGAPPA